MKQLFKSVIQLAPSLHSCFLLSHHAALQSVILSGHPDYYKSLKQMLAPVQVPGTRWEICYRGSEQGYRAHRFHWSCDNIGSTLTLVRVNQSVFGGYAAKNWNSSSKRICYCGFLFLWISIQTYPIFSYQN